MDVMRTKDKAEIGLLCSDIKHEGIIIKEYNRGPKDYMYEYINNRGEIHTTLRLKGIPASCLKEEYYDNKQHKIEFDILKKKGLKLSKKDVNNGVSHFSISNLKCSRTINKSAFKGMNYDNESGKWRPFGFIKEEKNDIVDF